LITNIDFAIMIIIFNNDIDLNKRVKKMEQGKINKFMEDLKMFMKAAFDMNNKATTLMKKEAMDELDNFMLLCYADLLGLPIPNSYYTLEILPYIAEDLEGWERRILSRKSVVGDRWGDFCC